MTEYEDLLRQDAANRGWVVEVHGNTISVYNVPYRKIDGEAGRCRISVDTQEDGLSLKAPENSGGATHAARLIGVSDGCAYQATGEPVGNLLWTDEHNECVISIILDEGYYANAWHALVVYAARVTGEVGREDREPIEQIFCFQVAGEDDRSMRVWRDKSRGQRIGIVGLGGVGLWILDLMCKTYVSEIRIWDGDVIEGRNLLRAPGWAGIEAIGHNKAEYYGERYQRMRKGITVYGEYWQSGESSEMFRDLNFVFVAVDKADTRTLLCEALERLRIPFIDVGMGIERRQERVRGSCQVFFSGEVPARWRRGIPTAQGAGGREYYELQLADIGALNAALAVGIWRRHIGQYEQEEKTWLTRYWIESNELMNRVEE